MPPLVADKAKSLTSSWTPEQKVLSAGSNGIHNTCYGAAGNKNLPLYDDYMRSKVCRVSQLIIIAVAMDLFSIDANSIKILQTNTDGILLYMPRKYLAEAQRRIAAFEPY